MYGFEKATAKDDSSDDPKLPTAMVRDEEFLLAGVRRPVDLMPRIEPLSKLYWFVQNISPALFFIPKVRTKMGPAGTHAMRAHIEDDLKRTYLKPWGY